MTNEAPAPISTPATTEAPAAPVVSPSSQARPTAPKVKPAAAPERKAYNTKPKYFVPETGVSQAPAVAAVEAAAAVAKPVSELLPVENAPVAQPDTAKPVEASTEPAKTEPEVRDSDLARRLAKISKAEGKLADERKAFAAERQQHASSLKELENVKNAFTAAHKDPLGFMQRVFGPNFAQTVVDKILESDAKTPDQKLAAQIEAQAAKINAFEKQIQDKAKAEEEQSMHKQVSDYVTGTLKPLLADPAYKFTSAELGENAPVELWNAILQRRNKNGAWPTHDEVVSMANNAERHFKTKAEQSAKMFGYTQPQSQSAETPKAVAPPASNATREDKTFNPSSVVFQPRKGTYRTRNT